MRRLLRELDAPAGRAPGTRRRAALAVVLVPVVLAGGAASYLWQDPFAWQRLTERFAQGDAHDYTFVATQPHTRDVPVTYSPCRPVELFVNSDQAPPGSEGIIAEAVAEVSDATGLRLRVVGDSHLRTTAWTRHLGRLPAGEVAPSLVAWETPEQTPELQGRVAGVGGSVWRSDGRRTLRYYVGGTVALDAPTARRILQSPRGREYVVAIVMHELGHLVGLGHVDAPDELMSAENHGLLTWGPGDRAGLSAVGAGRCLGPD